MMRLSELAEKELIEVENGIRYGYLSESECLFDTKTGKIHGFELEAPMRLSFMKKKEETMFIPWEEILLIGEDRILFQKIQKKKYDRR